MIIIGFSTDSSFFLKRGDVRRNAIIDTDKNLTVVNTNINHFAVSLRGARKYRIKA